MQLLPFRYFITKGYLFHFTLKSVVATILTRPYFFCPPFLSETFGDVTEDLTTVLSWGNSCSISVHPPPPQYIMFSGACSVQTWQFHSRLLRSSLLRYSDSNPPFAMNVLLLTGVCVQHLLSVRGKLRGQQIWSGCHKNCAESRWPRTETERERHAYREKRQLDEFRLWRSAAHKRVWAEVNKEKSSLLLKAFS